MYVKPSPGDLNQNNIAYDCQKKKKIGILFLYQLLLFILFLRSSVHMKDAILEGGNQFKKVHGMPIFQYMDMDPTFNELFNKGMADLSTIIMKKILEVYQGFEGLTSLVDVGGGTGKCLSMIISKNASIKGINFDSPHVTQSAPSYLGIISNFLSRINSNNITVKCV